MVKIFDKDGLSVVAATHTREEAIAIVKAERPGERLIGGELIDGRWVGFFVGPAPAGLGA